MSPALSPDRSSRSVCRAEYEYDECECGVGTKLHVLVVLSCIMCFSVVIDVLDWAIIATCGNALINTYTYTSKLVCPSQRAIIRGFVAHNMSPIEG